MIDFKALLPEHPSHFAEGTKVHGCFYDFSQEVRGSVEKRVHISRLLTTSHNHVDSFKGSDQYAKPLATHEAQQG